MQVVWCGMICLNAVRDPIHRLLVHQSEASLGTTSHIWDGAQFASGQETIYIVKSTPRIALQQPLRKSVPGLKWNYVKSQWRTTTQVWSGQVYSRVKFVHDDSVPLSCIFFFYCCPWQNVVTYMFKTNPKTFVHKKVAIPKIWESLLCFSWIVSCF